MKNRSKPLLQSMVAGMLVLGAASAGALTIEYSAVNLADVTAGQDLWRYNYRVSGYSFQQNEGFDIYFDQALYGALTNPQPDSGPEWYASSSVSSPPGAGQIYDAITIVANPSLDLVFAVDFVWKGGSATPGAQPFDAFRTGPGSTIEIFAAGNTSVPDRGPGLLLVGLTLGLFGLPQLRRGFQAPPA